MCVTLPSATGKMNPIEPGVWPGIATGVTLTPPSVTGLPSSSTRSRVGGLSVFEPTCAGGFAGRIKSQSAPDKPDACPVAFFL